MTEPQIKESDVMPRRPWLRRYFWVQRGYNGCWEICWYQQSPIHGWGISRGLRFTDIREAKLVRRLLNSRVGRPLRDGLPFADVVRFVVGGSVDPDDTHAQF